MLRKVFHILLAVLVFVSSSGLVFSKHYCQGVLKNTSLFAEAAPCHGVSKAAKCPRHAPAQEDGLDKKDCCDTQTDFLKVEDAQLSTLADLLIVDTPAFLAVLFFFLPFEVIAADTKTRHDLHYKPPLLVCDLSVSLQTFLC
ncbi:HYC_CC_PP family protein [Lewinella cohaerens]|uniref:HYC_CC_PP family protein n=1 Tax=Lewinella cohaerens TaxID=70995 RepID=UPI0003673B70|nr:hypothetical protein [Lewinella cohaerens]